MGARRWAAGLAVVTLVGAAPVARKAQAADPVQLVKDVNVGRGDVYLSQRFVAAGGFLYFAGDDGSHGWELWKSDGTTAGTVMLKDMVPGSDPSNPPYGFTVVGSTVYFFAFTGADRSHTLWKTDGTEAGTTPVKDVSTPVPTYYDETLAIGSNLYFVPGGLAVVEGSYGGLWKSDGTEAGTTQLLPDQANDFASFLTSFGGKLVFTGEEQLMAGGPQVWTSDGTAAGTSRLKRIGDGLFPNGYTSFQGFLYFGASDLEPGGAQAQSGLWRTDGTAGGTVLVAGASRDMGSAEVPCCLAVTNGTLLFFASTATSDFALWKSDGTELGTSVLREGLFPLLGGQKKVVVGNSYYFVAADGSPEHALWKSDGTTGGTVRVTPAGISVDYYSLFDAGGTLVFGADDGVHGTELWASDGTPSGTKMVEDIATGVTSSSPHYFTVLGQKLLFTAAPAGDSGGNGYKLYSIGLDQLGGSGGGPPPDDKPATESYFLPTKIAVKFSPTASKSTLTAVGTFDTGPGAVNLGEAATLDVGGLSFAMPTLTPKGKSFTYKAPGISFSITPNKSGSSRAAFKLKATGDLTGKVATDGPLHVHFKGGGTEGGGDVLLSGGKYALGKKRGALVDPNLYLAKVKASLKGAGKDAFSLLAGLATKGTTPAAAPDVTIDFGGGFTAVVTSSSFVKTGDKFSFKGSANGVTGVVLDYLRETIKVSGKSLTIGTYPDGPDVVRVGISLGADVRGDRVRMVKKGSSLKY